MLVNLTSHPVIIRDPGTHEVIVTIPTAGPMARVETGETVAGPPLEVDGVTVPTTVKTMGTRVLGLPDPAAGTLYIVPLLTAQAAQAAGRVTDDLLIPDGQTRNAGGTVDGCASLGRLA
jgi:hypothetical protein